MYCDIPIEGAPVAMDVLIRAERRNLIARQVAFEIQQNREVAFIPTFVLDFLCGPWAQVVANAQVLNSGLHTKFHALIPAMLWSTHSGLAAKDAPKLVKLLPRLSAVLRMGLNSIQYSRVKSSKFMEQLFLLYHGIFSEERSSKVLYNHPEVEFDSWIAPAEAKVSNFIEMAEIDLSKTLASEPVEDTLSMGIWVELQTGDSPVRTQLTWISPKGSLFLFTSVLGASQSMTRRSLDKLMSMGKMRVLRDGPQS